MAGMHQAFLFECGITNQLTKNKKERELSMANNNEKSIVMQIVNDALRKGYFVNIDNGGESFELKKKTNDINLIIDTLFATDEEYIFFYEKSGEIGKYKQIGYVYLVYNNDTDVICDYTCNEKMEELLSDSFELAQALTKR